MSSKNITELNERLLSAIPLLINNIGRDSFAEAWLKCVNELVTVDQFGLLVFDANLKPTKICHAALAGQERTVADRTQYYLKYFHTFDPSISELQDNQQKLPLSFFRIRSTDITNIEYRKQMYDRYKVRERLIYLGRSGNLWYSANLFRLAPNPMFSEEDVARLNMYQAHFIDSLAHHISLVAPGLMELQNAPRIDFLAELVTELGGELSPREIDVIARALSGMTKNGIALDLDVKPPTINTLTQRAYRKLDVSNLNEIFALCLRSMAIRASSTNKQWSE